MIKSVTIFYPDGTSTTYTVGAVITDGTITAIQEGNLGCKIICENGYIITYINMLARFVEVVL